MQGDKYLLFEISFTSWQNYDITKSSLIYDFQLWFTSFIYTQTAVKFYKSLFQLKLFFQYPPLAYTFLCPPPPRDSGSSCSHYVLLTVHGFPSTGHDVLSLPVGGSLGVCGCCVLLVVQTGACCCGSSSGHDSSDACTVPIWQTLL